MNQKQIEPSFESEPKIEGFPLAYDRLLNIVINLTNKVCFA